MAGDEQHYRTNNGTFRTSAMTALAHDMSKSGQNQPHQAREGRSLEEDSQYTGKFSPFLPAYLNGIDAIRKKQGRDVFCMGARAHCQKGLLEEPLTIIRNISHF